MGEVIGKIDMKYVEQARKERRFLYVDWKTGNVMLSDVSKVGGKMLSDEELEKRKTKNEEITTKRKRIRKEISELRKDSGKAGRKGDAKKVSKIAYDIAELEKEYANLVKKPLPPRAKKKID